MNKRRIWTGAIVLLVALFLVRTAGAQSSAHYGLAWYALAGGGARSESAHYAMHTTVGQAAVGWSDDTQYAMSSGYWQNWPDYRTYLPLVMRDA